MARSSRALRVMLGVGAVVCAAGAVGWWMWPRRAEFYTDADAIRLSPEEARLRDVLWRPPEGVGVNGAGDEVEPRVSGEGDVMYFARRGEDGDADLFVARRIGEGWGEAEAVVGVNTLDNELGGVESPDGRWLYFSSDRAGGLGGFDLWRAARAGDGWGEAEWLGEGVNSGGNDGWAALTGDGQLYFASDRVWGEGDGEERGGGGFDIYVVEVEGDGFGEVERVEAVASAGDEVGPAWSPVGDFLYFASNREGGRGGFDLYRSRVADGEVWAPEAVGEEVNTGANELDPTVSMGGFALHFSSDRVGGAGGYDVLRTTSREVYLGAETRWGDWAALLALLPWILAVLALVLLLSLLRRLAGDEAWRVRWGTLSLMAKCVLLSLLLHAALLALLSLWDVRSRPGELMAREGSGVALRSSAVASAVEAQLRGDRGGIAIEPVREVPEPERRVVLEASEGARARAEVRPVETEVREASMGGAGGGVRVAEASGPEAGGPEVVRRAVARSSPVRVAVPEGGAARRVEGAEASETVAAEVADAGEVGMPRLFEGAGEAARVELGVEGAEVVEDGARMSAAGAVMDDSRVEGATESARRARVVEMERGALELALPGGSVAEGEGAVEVGVPGVVVERAEVDSRPRVRLGEGGVSGEVALQVEGEGVIEDGALAVEGLRDARVEGGAPARRSARGVEREAALEVALPQVGLAAKEEEVRLRLTGVVVEKGTGRPIEGADVRLDLEGRAAISVETDAEGRFALAPEAVPDHSAVTASKRGYVPGALNVSEEDFERGVRVVMVLERHNPFVIALEERPEVHHLGNDEFTGRVNSQFQRRSEGTRLVMRFELDSGRLPQAVVGAELRLLAKGVQVPNPVFVNGRRLGRLPESPEDGSFGEVALRVPLGWLVEGRNEVELRSVRNPGTDVDDYEFVNVRLVLRPGEVGM